MVFSGNKGEVITGGSNGSLKITYSGGAISAAPASSGGTSVTVTTDGQESDFYMAILPVNFSEGIVVRCYDAAGYLLCERKTSGALNTVSAAGLPIIANLGSLQAWLDNPQPTAVDLGLSVKWASFNLGAASPEGSGDYFSWGETAPKSAYSWSTYAYGQSKNGPFSKYVLDSSFGTIDYKTVLDLEDDAAHAIWGDAWRMPSKEEVQELRNSCTWTWTTMNGVNGYKVTSKKSGYTSKFIFLPAAGMMSGSKVQNAGTEGDYWSSSLYAAESCSSWSPYFTSSQFSTGDCYRYFGLPVRPVYGEVVPVAEITLNYSYLELLKDGTSQLTATISPANATYKGLMWTSSDESIATVDQSGKVKAVALGKAVISAHSADNKILGICEIAVIQKAESIALDRTELDIYVGDEPTTLVATVSPAEHTTKLISWSSSKPSVAAVDENGNVTAVAAGTATIQAQALDGTGLTAKCVVMVYNKHAESITVSKQAITIYIDKTYKLTATVYPSNANKTVIWSSDNTDIATVDESGTVKGVGIGTTTVTATTKDGSLSASCEVTVFQYVTSITLDKTEVEMYVGDEPVVLTATVSPSEYVNSSIYWYSSNSFVAKVNSDGIVTAVSNGTATVYARANDGSGVRGGCTVSVSTHVESIAFDKPVISMFKNRTVTLVAIIQPSNATNKAIIWSSDTPSVASIDDNGTVHSIREGSAIITATSEDRGFYAQCRIDVIPVPQPEAVDLGLPSGLKWASMNVGATKPEEYGDYFAWGETEPYYEIGYAQSNSPVWRSGMKSGYDWPSYKWCNSTDHWYHIDYSKLIKYCTDSNYWDATGPMDYKTVLDLEDDAAHVNLDGSWRMPTLAECQELLNKCTWTWTTQNGVIFGVGSDGYYWSSSLYTDFPNNAYSVIFYSDFYNWSDGGSRYSGQSVRPVSE